jgi:hypothetical protein
LSATLPINTVLIQGESWRSRQGVAHTPLKSLCYAKPPTRDRHQPGGAQSSQPFVYSSSVEAASASDCECRLRFGVYSAGVRSRVFRDEGGFTFFYTVATASARCNLYSRRASPTGRSININEFTDAVFKRLGTDEVEIGYGMSEAASRASREELDATIQRMNSR